jgi:flagellar hook-associated protein 1 FlgK
MFDMFNIAQTGLNTSQTQLENVMNNLANQNTPGYKKRVVDVKEVAYTNHSITGRGVEVVDINRITNIYMYDNLTNENSKKNYLDELSTMLGDVESIFHETEDSGLSYDLEKFFNSLENMRISPNDAIYKSNLIDAGNALVDDLKKMYSEIEDREQISMNFLKDFVAETNGILEDIGIVNQEFTNSNLPSNNLLDQRDQLEMRMSQYLGIKVDRTDGDYSLETGGLTAVRYNTNVHQIDISQKYLPQKDVYVNSDNESTLINKNTWNDNGDSVTVYINKDYSVTATYGESYDIDGDGNDETIDENNVVRAIVSKINNNPDMSKLVVAYNGQYTIDENGNKISQQPEDEDHYLLIESKVDGIGGRFESQVFVNDDDHTNTNGEQVLYTVDNNELRSVKATNDIHLEIFDKKIDVKEGKIGAILENVDTINSKNKFQKYKDMLDNFAKTLADLMDSYIYKGDPALDNSGEYIYGKEATLLDSERSKRVEINLFSGSDVKSLTFNEDKVNELDQPKLDYLTAVRWKDDIDFNKDGGGTTLTEYYQEIRVSVSADKENTDYLQENQEAVYQSLQLSYDKLTKVNSDDEMLNLVQFQRAYEANAKVITTLDSLLQTLLGMKR